MLHSHLAECISQSPIGKVLVHKSCEITPTKEGSLVAGVLRKINFHKQKVKIYVGKKLKLMLATQRETKYTMLQHLLCVIIY